VKHTLILDLDETLFHATEIEFLDEMNIPHDFMMDDFYHVYLRPHLQDFLKTAFEYFDVAVWTSASQSYAEDIVKKIFPDNLKFLYTREQCTKKLDYDTMEFVYLKNLKNLKKLGYDINKLLIVDDSPEKVAQNYGNYIPITPFYGDQKDIQLKLLKDYIITLADRDDIRKLEKRNWNKMEKK
jgi:TFIIF-interacting CTD phosphatase-like protein